MYVFEHSIYKLKQEVGDDLVWYHALQYPEINRISEVDAAAPQYDRRLNEISEGAAPEEFGQRVLANAPEIARLSIKLTPPGRVERKRYWIDPIELDVSYVAWQRNDQLVSAYVPSLGLHVTREGKIDPKFVGDLRVEIRSSLIRSGMLEGLEGVARLEEFGQLELVESRHRVRIPSAKQIAMDEPRDNENEELPVVATRVDDGGSARRNKKQRKKIHPVMPAFHIEERVAKLAEMLGEPESQSVLLVGPVGVGKTQTFLELARCKRQFGFSQSQFWETSGSRIVAGMSGFGQWQQRCQKMARELKTRQGVLCVGNLMELLKVGKSSHQSQTVASWMQTHVQRGSMQIVAECTPAQLAIIEQREPQLLGTLAILRIEKPGEELQKKIFSSAMDYMLARLPRDKANVLAAADGLDAIYRFHRRYATYSANPGRPLQFMQRLVEDASTEVSSNAAEDSIVEIDSSFVGKAFATQTGLPYFLLNREESLDLSNLNSWFSQRVIGQPAPVETVVDLVATVKAGLSPIGKPIASLMFIGPTGVGKTEMAKSLAEFMFSSQQRLLRFDMSEFGDRLGVQRLIGGTGEKEGLLTGKVRQHPFSVVLFDEFEKAHPAFMDLLLQVLGEGRLTDGHGQTTDFSTTIVVITSNLGAEQFKPVATGFVDPNASQSISERRYEDHFVEQVRQRLRPELFNRIDRIVPFRPLDIDTVRQIVRREFDKLKRREGILNRGVEVEITDETCDWLAGASLDLRYGARPIQRLLHDRITIPLAEKLASYSSRQRVSATIGFDAEANKIHIEAKGVDAKQRNRKTLISLTKLIQDLRRKSHRLSAGNATLRLKNEMYQRLQASDRNARRVKKLTKKLNRKGSSKLAEEIGRLENENRKLEVEIAQYRHHVERAREIHEECCLFEEEYLLRFYDQENIDYDKSIDAYMGLERSVREVIFENFLFEADSGNSVTLLIWARNNDVRDELARGYLDFASTRNFRSTGYWVLPFNPQTPQEQVFCRMGSNDEDVGYWDVHQKGRNELFVEPPSNLVAVALKFVGPAAFPMYGYERGRHLFKNDKTREAIVEVVGSDLHQHELSYEVVSGDYDSLPVQRTYHFQRHLFEDIAIGKHSLTESSGIRQSVKVALEAALQHHLEKYIK